MFFATAFRAMGLLNSETSIVSEVLRTSKPISLPTKKTIEVDVWPRVGAPHAHRIVSAAGALATPPMVTISDCAPAVTSRGSVTLIWKKPELSVGAEPA
jgi:hypothetical protein